MKKVLLSNAMGPYDLTLGENTKDMFGSRMTRGQDIFTFKGHAHTWPLYIIAENIPAYATVLENPTEEIFIEELKRGYDYVTFELKTIYVPKIVKMVKIIRKISPESKIVVGGYGTMTLYNPVPSDPENCAGYLLDNVDYICKGEGIGYMRKLLGGNVDDPVTQEYLPKCGMTLQGFQNFFQFSSTAILVSLGCPNACEFCFTSAYYKAKKITISTPEQLFHDLKSAQERTGSDSTLFNMVFDEDLMQNKEYVMRLGELLRGENLLGKLNFFCFGSIQALSQWTPEELALCGVGAIFIGVESSLDDVITSDHDIKKRAGKGLREVFDGLHEYGIIIIGATILGWDFHTKENIYKDFDHFISLKPDMYQVAPLIPCPGTKLFGRLTEQGRIPSDRTWENYQQCADDLFDVLNFEKNEINRIYNEVHETLYKKNGPTVLNLADVLLKGYRTMLHSSNPHLQERADRCYYFAKKLIAPLFPSLRKWAPSQDVLDRIDEVEDRFTRYIGNRTIGEKFIGNFIIKPLLGYERSRRQKPGYENDPEEPWRITYYHGDKSAPVVLRRKDPFVYARTELQRRIVHKIIRLKQKQIHTIKLKDIDDFPVTFKTMEIEGNRLGYVDEGDGEVILMIHGNPTWSYLYRHFIKALKNDYRCIAIDLLGYGLSDKPPNADYSMEAHIRRLGKLVEGLGLNNINLICQDWGGIIGLSYAARNKDKFVRLMPMNTTGFLPDKFSEYLKFLSGVWAIPFLWSFRIPVLGKKVAMDWNLFLKLAMKLGVYNSKRQIHNKAWLGYLYPYQRVEDRIAILKSVRQVSSLPGGKLWNLLKKTGELLKGWDIRTQLIWGTKDKVFVPWFIDKFEELLPNHAQTLRIPTASHFLQDDEPEIIISKIKEFMCEELIPSKKEKKAKYKKTVSA